MADQLEDPQLLLCCFAIGGYDGVSNTRGITDGSVTQRPTAASSASSSPPAPASDDSGARPTGAWERAIKWMRRRPGDLAAAMMRERAHALADDPPLSWDGVHVMEEK